MRSRPELAKLALCLLQGLEEFGLVQQARVRIASAGLDRLALGFTSGFPLVALAALLELFVLVLLACLPSLAVLHGNPRRRRRRAQAERQGRADDGSQHGPVEIHGLHRGPHGVTGKQILAACAVRGTAAEPGMSANCPIAVHSAWSPARPPRSPPRCHDLMPSDQEVKRAFQAFRAQWSYRRKRPTLRRPARMRRLSYPMENSRCMHSTAT